MPDYQNRKGVVLGKLCKYGHDHQDGQSYRTKSNSTCCECTDIRISRWRKTERGKASAKATKDRSKEKIKMSSKIYRKVNSSRIAKQNIQYRKNNRSWYLNYYRVYNSMRKAKKLMATPSWANQDEIKDIYRQAHEMSAVFYCEFQVDHIVPLISDIVCGLHCEQNLRVITASENASKGNRYWPDMP